MTGFLASQNYYLNLNFTMQRDYDILILEDQHSPHFLEQGFIECIVSQTVRPFKTRHFFYCVHCGKLRSSSWFFDHRKTFEFDLSTKSIQKYRSCFFHFFLATSILKLITCLKKELCLRSVGVREVENHAELGF